MVLSTIVPRCGDPHLAIKTQLANALIKQKLEGEASIFINGNSNLSIRSSQACKFHTIDKTHLNGGSKVLAQIMRSAICEALEVKRSQKPMKEDSIPKSEPNKVEL